MIKIIADSTCDLSDEILELHHISLVPLHVTLDGKQYRDRVDIMPDDLFSVIDELEEPVRTGNPSPEEFCQEMERAIEEGHEAVLCINMSSGTSGSYQSAVLGRVMYYDRNPESTVRIRVVDSVSMSHGTGWLVLKAAQLIESGLAYDDVIDFIEMYKFNVKHFLSVDDLDHLIRSGRLTNASAMIGKLLKVKPIMSMKNRKGVIVAKERGRKRVLQHYVRELKARIDREATNFIIIGYTSDRILAENLQNLILKEEAFDGKIFIMQMGVAVGGHVGLGGLSLFFVEKDHQKDGLLVNELKHLEDKKEQMMNLIKKYQMKK